MNAREHFDPREMTANTIGRDLLSALVAELKLLPQPWVKLSQSKQDDIIDRLRDRVDANIKMAVHLIASEGRTVVQGDLDQVTIKDGAKVVIKIGRGAESLHDLYDSQGKAVLIVVADSQPHTGGMGQVRGEANQRAMNLGKEYTDLDGDGTIDRSEYPDRVCYEADRVRFVIGEIDKEPWVLDYDADKCDAQPQTDKDTSVRSCPSGDGSLRPCAAHPQPPQDARPTEDGGN